MTNTSLTLLFHQTIPIQASYLLVWRFGLTKDGNDSNQPLHGYQINHHKFTAYNQTIYMITLGKPISDPSNWDKTQYIIDKVNNTYPSENFNITVPKPNIQGVYCASNQYFETRLRFYFSASNNHTFVYQGILDYKDINNDGVINGDGGNIDYGSYLVIIKREWAWETFFYSMGTLKFDYYLNDTLILKTYLSKPQTVNPFNYNSPVSKNPKVYVEDIKGFYIMNLPSATNQSDSDDWTLTSIQVTMDDNSLIPVQPDIVSNYYDIKIDVPNMEFGDDLTDILGSLYSFNSFVGDRDPYMTKYASNFTNYLNFRDLYNKMKTCYASYGSYCLYKDIIGDQTDFYTYFENTIICDLLQSNHIFNASQLGRKTPIKGTYICPNN